MQLYIASLLVPSGQTASGPTPLGDPAEGGFEELMGIFATETSRQPSYDDDEIKLVNPGFSQGEGTETKRVEISKFMTFDIDARIQQSNEHQLEREEIQPDDNYSEPPKILDVLHNFKLVSKPITSKTQEFQKRDSPESVFGDRNSAQAASSEKNHPNSAALSVNSVENNIVQIEQKPDIKTSGNLMEAAVEPIDRKSLIPLGSTKDEVFALVAGRTITSWSGRQDKPESGNPQREELAVPNAGGKKEIKRSIKPEVEVQAIHGSEDKNWKEPTEKKIFSGLSEDRQVQGSKENMLVHKSMLRAPSEEIIASGVVSPSNPGTPSWKVNGISRSARQPNGLPQVTADIPSVAEPVDISVSNGTDVVEIRFGSKNTETIELLSRHQLELRNDLKRAGIEECDLGFDTQDDHEARARQGHQSTGHGALDIFEPEAPMMVEPGLVRSEGLDLRV
ncbi:flagellar hook-length control protein FliK [Marivita sp.]|uniref:flagellar hook-length control protein FliK n=1 Tax=Marivita sp. TaxID=2003365 RepID=UPI0025C6866D|nr:flagellar hook-length control protein FliK [Marivita sp.]